MITRRAFYLVILLWGFNVSVWAGTTGKIVGQVVDEEGYPLPGAVVMVEDTGLGASTDVEGIYVLLAVPPGKYMLVGSMIGFQAEQKTDVLVSSDFTTNVSFTLQSAPLEMDEMVVTAQSGSAAWSMFSLKAQTPPVEADKTTSQSVIRAEDIEALPLVQNLDELIELQAGVTVDEEGSEISIRAGEPDDVAYYLDGVPIFGTDGLGNGVYRDFNRLSIQELTVVTGGINAEYGNAQGGMVSVVTREGTETVRTLLDYRVTPPGKKHWGANVYESPLHQGNVKWNDPVWTSETVALPDGRTVLAHPRRDYTAVWGHHAEGNLSGTLVKNTTFFTSGRWRRDASVFPSAHLSSPFNMNTSLKLTHRLSSNINVRVGGLYDRRRNPGNRSVPGGRLDLREGGRNLFLVDANTAGDFADKDHLIYATLTHLISPKTFYEVRFSQSVSSRDTVDVRLPMGVTHISEAVTHNAVRDGANYFNVYRSVVDWERFYRKRWILQGDLTSQLNRRHLFKTGFSLTRFDNWAQTYRSQHSQLRFASWYGRSYSDTDFFPGQKNQGLNPVQLSSYVQDKIELGGMIVNAGLRWDVFLPRTRVTDANGFMGLGSPMWNSMTRVQQAPTIDAPTIQTLSPRLGISHPVTERSVLRFFYGQFKQLPRFEELFVNSWASSEGVHQDLDQDGFIDPDFNKNGAIDPAERWNEFDNGGLVHNPYLSPEETTSFEVGLDWNFAGNYVLGLTTYYKSAINQVYDHGIQNWVDPDKNNFAPLNSYTTGVFRDARGFELNLRKRFSQLFAFNFALNLQWADEGRTGLPRRDVLVDSLFVANGHYWQVWDVDPTTGAEVPVSLQAQAVREGRDLDYYVTRIGAKANVLIQRRNAEITETRRERSWASETSHYAEAGVPYVKGELDPSQYSNADRAFWARLNSDPNYPGVGEGNVLVSQTQETGERLSSNRDRRSFGSMTFLFMTPQKFGPFNGKAIGNIRANMVYRLYTGTPFFFTPLLIDSSRPQDQIGARQTQKYGPMHTRTDVNIAKRFGDVNGRNLTLGIDMFNLFNQKDARTTPPGDGRSIDLKTDRWQQWGIESLDPISGIDEVFDVNNYWDQPRSITFSAQIAW